ncbi:peptide pheromone VP1, partial [Streptococcus oralis]
MLNLQFAETMELTEAELQDVRGGNTVVNPGGGIGVGWGGLGTPWS